MPEYYCIIITLDWWKSITMSVSVNQDYNVERWRLRQNYYCSCREANKSKQTQHFQKLNLFLSIVISLSGSVRTGTRAGRPPLLFPLSVSACTRYFHQHHQFRGNSDGERRHEGCSDQPDCLCKESWALNIKQSRFYFIFLVFYLLVRLQCVRSWCMCTYTFKVNK